MEHLKEQRKFLFQQLEKYETKDLTATPSEREDILLRISWIKLRIAAIESKLLEQKADNKDEIKDLFFDINLRAADLSTAINNFIADIKKLEQLCREM